MSETPNSNSRTKSRIANIAMKVFIAGVGVWVATMYTDGLVGGYCRITQIDPVG